jgi:glycosyltransferase involved in cell wall biosynthesis
VEAETLMMQVRFAYSESTLMRRARASSIRACIHHSGFSRLSTIDVVSLEALGKLHPQLARQIHPMPDPVFHSGALPADQARRKLGIPLEGKYIATTGSLDARKGVDRLIQAFNGAQLSPDWRLLIAGKAQPDIKDALQRDLAPLVEKGRAVWINRFLSDDEITAMFSAMNILCTPYIGHLGSSGIVIHAAHVGVPVLATDYGWCGDMIPRLGIGWVCDTANDKTFIAALEHAASQPAPLPRTPILTRFLEYTSLDNFVAAWTSRIRERLSLPPVRVLDWKWVIHGD